MKEAAMRRPGSDPNMCLGDMVGSVAGSPLYGNASPSSQMTLYDCSMIVLSCSGAAPAWRRRDQRQLESTSGREAPRLPSSTKRIAVQVTFDNFGRAIQDVYATTLATTAPVSNPVAFNARGDELLGCFLLERIYSATVRGGASRWWFVHDALINLGLSTLPMQRATQRMKEAANEAARSTPKKV
jgi:hypothetical protein